MTKRDNVNIESYGKFKEKKFKEKKFKENI